MTKASIEALALRAEQATGLDRELDRAIMRASAYWHKANDAQFADNATPPRYTASLDPAMSLIPEGWAWQTGVGIETEAGNVDRAYAWCAPVDHGQLVFAATPALALTAACLRARKEP